MRADLLANIMSKNGGIIGVSDHGGWAVLVTAARDGTLLDRLRVELVDEAPRSFPITTKARGSRWTRPWRWLSACAFRLRGMYLR